MTLAELATAVARAQPATPEDAPKLARAEAILSGKKLLTVGQVAEILGIKSPSTVRNWLENGYFPDAGRTAGGHRRFLISDVLEIEARLERSRQDAEGDRPVTDLGDVDPFARRQARRDAVVARRR